MAEQYSWIEKRNEPAMNLAKGSAYNVFLEGNCGSLWVKRELILALLRFKLRQCYRHVGEMNLFRVVVS
jgi:hypothetical protein